MSVGTALLWLLGLSVLALGLVLGVVWRRLADLSRQVSALASERSPLGGSAEPFLGLQRGPARPTSSEPASNATAVASFPLITDTPGRTGAVQLPDSHLTTARVASVSLAEPLIKVAAFTSGVRRALDQENRLRVSATFRRELRRQRKLRRRSRAGASRAQGPRP